jgi:hypothetical protein
MIKICGGKIDEIVMYRYYFDRFHSIVLLN